MRFESLSLSLVMKWTPCALFTLALVCVAPAHADEPILYPDDARLVDVTQEPYLADPTGQRDSTAAIQKAFDTNRGGGNIIYLPPGQYLISDTIKWAGRRSFNMLYGAGQEHTTIRLADNAPGYDDPMKPKNMIWTGGPPAQRFKNAVRDLTIDSGRGNPGAVGLNFCANNQGGVFDVTIRSGEDGKQPGAVGLGLDEAEVGPLMVKNVTVIGFDLGIRVRHTVNSVTLEHITLRGQREAGIDNFNNMVFVRKLDSENAVPAVVNGGSDGVFTLIDSTLAGTSGAADRSAMLNRNPRAVLFVRNVETTGYAQAIKDEQADPVPTGQVEEWVSGPRVSLFPGEMRTLNLPIEETPTVPHDPLDQWVSPMQFGGMPGDKDDDTEAIQRAIDSGATTVYLPRGPGDPGAYLISDTIYIRGNVRRIVGLEASLEVTNALADNPDKPVFMFEDGDQPVVMLERLRFTFKRFPNPTLIHRADRDLVVSAFSEVAKPRHLGKGRLFLEDIVGHGVYVGPGATLFARQFNLEGGDWKLVNDGGTAWVMGIKTECRSPIALTKAGGTTEIIGGHLYKCVEFGVDKISFEVEDGGRMSLAGVAEYVWDPKFATEVVLKETRDGQTRQLTKHDLPPQRNAVVLPLVACFPAPIEATAPAAPTVKVADQTAASILLAFEAGDKPGDTSGGVAGFIVTRGDKPLGRHLYRARERGLEPDTEYTYTVIAYDRFGNLSSPTELVARTTPDITAPSTPENLHTLHVTDHRVHLKWRDSRDEIGVAGYIVERAAGDSEPVALDTVKGTEFEDRKVSKGTAYRYRVIALDAADNRSKPATLDVKVPDHPPYAIKQEAERYDDGYGSIKRSWFLFNLHGGCWMLYKDLELGRDQPFDQFTIRYGAPNDRAGSKINVYLNPTIEEIKGKRRVTDGDLIAEVTVESTGGWEDFKTFTVPVKIEKPGRHDVVLAIERGEARESNALVNIDWIELGFIHPPSE